MDPCQTVQHITDHASPVGSAPTVCGRWQVLHPTHLLRGQRLYLYRVSPAACDLAPVSSHGVLGQPGTLHPAGQSSGRGTAGGAEPLTAAAVSLFGLSPNSQ